MEPEPLVEHSKQVYANAWFSIREDTIHTPAGDSRPYAVL